jgi:GDP-L-fucose synthase
MGGCSYPGSARSPIIEEDMWQGFPHSSAAPYSSAKRMNIVMSQAYRKQYNFNSIVLVPGNIYGPEDNFDLNNSHVIPALIRKYYEAKINGADKVVAWGSGKPLRDFIYIGDAVEAIYKAACVYNSSDIINISSGTSVSIKDLTETIAAVVQFEGEILWDTSKPDGQMEKGFSVDKMQEILAFKPSVNLRDGLAKTYDWFVENYGKARLEH